MVLFTQRMQSNPRHVESGFAWSSNHWPQQRGRVNTRTKSELANIVAFTGNPIVRGDDRPMTFAEYQRAIEATQPAWQKL